MKSFAIIGMGLFGTHLAKELYESGHYVLAIDRNMDRIEAVADQVSQAVCLDAQNAEALSEVGIKHYDTVVVATTSELSSTILIALNLKSQGVPRIICKAKSEQDRQTLETLGDISVVIPEHMAAENLASRISHPNVLEYAKLHEQCELAEIPVPKNWVGRSIRKLNVRVDYGINIIGLRQNDTFTTSFDADTVFNLKDTITVIADSEVMQKFLSRVKNGIAD